MVSALFYASALALLSAASAQTTYLNNTNTACATSSDVDYQGNYFYDMNDNMDWGFYTQSTGTCDPGSYARVHVLDPSGNDIDCGYVALDGKLNLLSCYNYPRNNMQEGQYTVYWETVPGANQYSWNQFTLTHTQASVTAPTPTNTVTTTPVTVLTSTVTNAPTETSYVPQKTITTPSATQINTINVTLNPTTITTTTTSYYSIFAGRYVMATTTAVITAPCKQAAITKDFTGTRNPTPKTPTSGKKVTRESIFDIIQRLIGLRRRDGDKPNTVGMAGPPLTTTFTPNAVLVTSTAATVTSTVTTTTNLAAVVVTIENPTPTVTVFSGIAVSTTTITLPQVTKSVVKQKLSLTYITTTSTLYYTKKVTTTPICAPTGK